MSVKDGLTQRGSTWSYVVRVPDPVTGCSKPKWVGGFTTKENAKAARDAARVAARQGNYVDRSQITVAVYLREWLEGHRLAVKPKTHADYQEIVEGYLIPTLGKIRLQQLRPATVSKAYRELMLGGGRSGRPLSARTVDGVHRVLRKALNDAVNRDQLVATNPALRATRPRLETESIAIVWMPGQLSDFLKAAREHRLFAFLHLAAFTGARRGELLALRWKDVDLDAGEVTIRAAAAVIAGERIEGTPKGGRTRVVSIDDGTVTVLREHRRRQLVERLAAGSTWDGRTDHVFLTGTGAPIHADTPSKLVPIFAKVAGVPTARLHDLRHCHATTLLVAGVPVHVVSARLGHADPAVTLRTYAHVLRDHASGAADVFAAAIPTAI